MAKPMTSEEIEATITKSHANLLALSTARVDAKTADRAMVRELRAVFTAGQDNGQAIILERAESLIAPRFVDEKTSALGVAVTAILAWVAMVAGRSWSPGTADCCLLFSHNDEPAIGEDGARVRFCYGSDQAEAITVAASWCTEHMKNSAPKVPDTMPAPPDEAHLTELAENGSASDEWEKTHSDTEAFGGSDF